MQPDFILLYVQYHFILFKADVRGRPGSIKALTAEKLPGSEVRLSWKRPEDDGGVGVDYYQVERAEAAGAGESWLACGRSKENGFVVKGMLSGKTYR